MSKKLVSALGFKAVVIAMVIGGQIGREAGRAALSPPKSSQQDIESKLIEGLKTAAIEINKKCPMMVGEENRLDTGQRAFVVHEPGQQINGPQRNPKQRDAKPTGFDISQAREMVLIFVEAGFLAREHRWVVG